MAESIPGTAALVGIFTAILGVAMVAIIVSQKANTSAVLQALSSGTSDVIKAAVSPVTGAES